MAKEFTQGHTASQEWRLLGRVLGSPWIREHRIDHDTFLLQTVGEVSLLVVSYPMPSPCSCWASVSRIPIFGSDALFSMP